MRLLMVIAILIFAMPLTGFGWAEGSNILLDPNLMCKKTRRVRGKLAEICRHDSVLLKEIINGINLGFRECEFQFKNRRWNCTSLRKSMRKILMKDTRETGFMNAVTSAGVTFAMTKACTMGHLVQCSCEKSHPRKNLLWSMGGSTFETENQDPSQKKNHPLVAKQKRRIFKNIPLPDGDWEWGGCGDNVNFGLGQARAFLDAKYRKRSDLGNLVKLHNNNAGRLAIRDFMRLECKCHGLSGSCTVKTCWLKMPTLREVGARLKERFDGAFKVVARNDGNSFMPESETIKMPSKYDIVYADESPDFCEVNTKTGSIGTHGRECNATSQGVDGCDLLCCSRGYDHRIVKENVNCKCVFKWCCEVTCSICQQRRDVSTCR
ncbi:protein Wnt-1 [Episyrphus balteatus]|uniref:protein Wnt-1 n=1 Tax=Episyrphus balteatus TaxID=286459 RepID=UPI002485A0D3|nr:protein Wnt-1 [Episyrphus balteatus]